MKQYIDKIYKQNKEKFIENLNEKIENEEKTFIITANPEILMMAEKDKGMEKIVLDGKTELVADGIGVVKAAKFFGIDLPERITGVDLSEHLIKYCNEHKKSMYLFGAKPEIIEKMKKKIETEYPNIQLLGVQNGYIKEKQECFEEIVKLSPDVVLVALGTPAQEKIIYENLDKFNKGIFIGVGGSFDVLSGSKKRAPKIFIKLNLEWLYRIAGSPKRWVRFYNGGIKFIIKAKKEAKKIK